MRFDWYQATVRHESPEDVLAYLAASLGAVRRVARGMHGYPLGAELVRGDQVVARCNWGGRNVWLNVAGSGEYAAGVADALRAGSFRSGHGVTRMDACEDFDGPGSFDRIVAVVLAIAAERGLVINQAGDWLTGGRLGRTLYVGAPSSAVRIRVYEKGKQLRAIGAPGAEDVSLDLVRVEVQVRPERESRAVASSCSPVEAFGFADWTVTVANRLLGADVERVHIKAVRDSDDERAFRHLARQYAAVLGRMADSYSTDAVTGEWADGWAILLARLQRTVQTNLEEE